MDRILFFSNNLDKVKEIKRIFKKQNLVSIYSPKDFDISLEPKEVGRSFAENARIKSIYGFKKTRVPSFADDSGICIEALNMKPGIHSKKFISNFKSRYECFKYIIKKVKITGKNKAFFQTTISYTFSDSYHIIFSGIISGVISKKPLGDNGFGYDPIFIPNGQRATLAQLSINKKNSISHRSIAINKLVNFLIH